jgi:hypothetical protein
LLAKRGEKHNIRDSDAADWLGEGALITFTTYSP